MSSEHPTDASGEKMPPAGPRVIERFDFRGLNGRPGAELRSSRLQMAERW